MKKFRFIILFLICSGHVFGQRLVSVESFGAIANAKKVNGEWVGTDNSKAFNRCASYCRKNGLTMFIPKGNYGVASTIWLTNPDVDGLKQAAITVIGSNRGAYMNQQYSSNICILKEFKSGRIVEVEKRDGSVREPHLVPVLGISNGRQVHIEGLGIQSGRLKDLISGIAIGNISQITSIKNCSIYKTYAGIIFPGLKPSPNKSVIEGNNDLLVVEQCSFRNVYNIVCAGTQPMACEYRNNAMSCIRSIFTGKLVTNFYGYSRGSHKFSSNLFGSFPHSPEENTVYFDLSYNEMTIDNCHFETGWTRKKAEVLIRAHSEAHPNGGAGKRCERLSFTNNMVNLANNYTYTDKYRSYIDTMIGNRMIIQGNHFYLGSACRIKVDGAIFIGNCIKLVGPHNLEVNNEVHFLLGTVGNIERGRYDFNHFIRKNSDVKIALPAGEVLKSKLHYKVEEDKNAFYITVEGKKIIDKAKTNRLFISYFANDAAKIGFEAWGGSKLNPPHGWRSQRMTFIGNKLVYKTDDGRIIEKELKDSNSTK